MTQRNPSKITTDLEVDDPLIQDAGFRLNKDDRQYIDNQILGIEQHLVDELIRGKHATYMPIASTSPSLVAGDVVCIATSENRPEVTKGLTTPLASAVVTFGVIVRAAAPNTYGLIAIGGALPPEITGLAKNNAGPVRVNPSTGRCERVASLDTGDYGIGAVTSSGMLNVLPGLSAAASVSGGAPGGNEGDIQIREDNAFGGLGGDEGDTIRRINGAWEAEPAAVLPEGDLGDVVGLDGLGGMVNLGPMSAGGGGGSGEINTASNVGSGEGIFKDKLVYDLRFKTLVAGDGVTLTPSADEIQIDATGAGGGEVNTGSNLGASGARVFESKVGVDFRFRRLVQGAGVTLTENANDITIASSTAVGGSDLQGLYNNAGVSDGMSGLTYDEATNRPQFVNGWYLASGANRMLFAGTPTAARTWTLQDATDTLVGRATSDTLTNKSINVVNNTLTATSTAQGDLLKSNGSTFQRFGRGSAFQILRVNAAGTDLEWATIATGGGSSNGPAGAVQTSNGAGGFLAATNVYGGTEFLSIGLAAALSGALRLGNSLPVHYRNGAGNADLCALNASSANDLFVGSSTTYGSQFTFLRLFASTGIFAGLGSSHGLEITGAGTVTRSAIVAGPATAEVANDGAFSVYSSNVQRAKISASAMELGVLLKGMSTGGALRLAAYTVNMGNNSAYVLGGFEYSHPVLLITSTIFGDSAKTLTFPVLPGAFWLIKSQVAPPLVLSNGLSSISLQSNPIRLIWQDPNGHFCSIF